MVAMMSSAEILKRIYDFIWEGASQDKPPLEARFVVFLRVGWVVIRDLMSGSLSLRAMSLVYTTLLSLVPALAIGFAIFRAFGFDNYVEGMLTDFLSPLGDQGKEVTTRVMEFVQRVNANVLGTVGFAFLIYTVISMIKKVEEAFNSIWHVEANRSLARQFTEIVSMGILGPLVMFTLAGIAAGALSNSLVGAVTSYGPIHFLMQQSSRLLPYALLIGAFTFLYAMVPNTRVRLSSALVGALVAGLIWGAIGWAFATFVVRSAQYVAIYSAFASLVVFMLWLYAAWLTLLGGCAIAFYYQNRAHLSPVAGLGLLTMPQIERMAAHSVLLVHEAFEKGATPWTEEALAQRLHLPMDAMSGIISALRLAGLIGISASSPVRILPARPADKTYLIDILRAMRVKREAHSLSDASLARDPRLEACFAAVSQLEEERLGHVTIASLLAKDATPATMAEPASMSKVAP